MTSTFLQASALQFQAMIIPIAPKPGGPGTPRAAMQRDQAAIFNLMQSVRHPAPIPVLPGGFIR